MKITEIDINFRKTANIFVYTQYCDRLWFDETEQDDMDRECGGIYLVHGKGDGEEQEFMSPLYDLMMPSPYIINQLNCLEQFFHVVPDDTATVELRQSVMKDIINEWDGIMPDKVEPFKNAVKIL